MSCKRWQQHILESIDSGQDPQPGEPLQLHLQQCPACAQTYAWQKAIHLSLKASRPVQAPGQFNQAVWRKISALPQPVRIFRKWLPGTIGVLGLAAAAAAMVVITQHALRHESLPRPEEVSRIGSQATPAALAKAEWATPVAAARTQVRKPVAARTPAALAQTKNRPESAGEQAPLQTTGQEQPRPESGGPLAARHTEQAESGSGPRHAALYSLGHIPGKPLTAPADKSAKAASAQPAVGNASQAQAQLVSQVRLLNNTIHLNRQEHTRLEFVLDHASHVRARIYSREGRMVRNLLDQDLTAGAQSLEWDGSTDAGVKVASGIYVLILSGDEEEKKFKLAVIK